MQTRDICFLSNKDSLRMDVLQGIRVPGAVASALMKSFPLQFMFKEKGPECRKKLVNKEGTVCPECRSR